MSEASAQTGSVGARAGERAAVASLLAFIAGFVDTTGFIVLAGIFLAHVTGNFVLLGAAIATGNRDVWGHIAVLPHFVLGVAAAWAIGRASGAAAARVIAGTEAGLLMAAAVAASVAQTWAVGHDVLLMIAMACGVTAMGVQSVLARILKLPMTHVMTGNVTQVTVEFLDARVCGRASNIWPGVALIASFLGGTLCAGFATASFGMMALGMPAVLLIFLVVGPRWLDAPEAKPAAV